MKSRGGFKQTSSVGESLQFLKVEIPEGNEIFTRTLKFKKDSETVSDVIKQITKKYKVSFSEEWGLFDVAQNRWLDLSATLSECNLTHMVRKKRI